MKFGTSGVRGLVVDMTDPVCAAWTTAFLRHLAVSGQQPASVLVGRDRRPSSERIAAACAAAVAADGRTALDAGIVPTPALALAAAARGVPAVMVTGSHIPFDRNGLKFYRPDGEITKADEAGIATARRTPVALPAAQGKPIEVGEAYVGRYVKFFGEGALVGLRLGVYRHSAAGRDLLASAVERLGGEVVPIGESDGFVPIDTEAIDSAVARQIAGWVAEHHLDALVSTDGDGDRPLVADERGSVLRGDALGILAARALGADAVAVPINVSTALERSGWFARTKRTRIGSPYVIEATTALAAGGARLAVGFEANGGFLLAGRAERQGRWLEPLPTRDAMLPILAFLAEVAASGRPPSALLETLPKRSTASGRVEEVAESASRGLLLRLESSGAARDDLAWKVAGAFASGIDRTDGLRMTLESGEILHLRASGNAPELRCYAEAEGEARALSLVSALLAQTSALLSAAS